MFKSFLFLLILSGGLWCGCKKRALKPYTGTYTGYIYRHTWTGNGSVFIDDTSAVSVEISRDGKSAVILSYPGGSENFGYSRGSFTHAMGSSYATLSISGGDLSYFYHGTGKGPNSTRITAHK